VFVLASCGSTMDVALDMHRRSRRALCVVALEQTAGRGTHGRRWDHTTDARGPLGVAMTLAIDAERYDARSVSVAAGVAACEAANTLCGKQLFRIKWPNDVVLSGDGRKLAGVLVEQRSGSLLVGVGLNVLHAPSDFSPAEADLRASLNIAGAQSLTTLEAACAVLAALAHRIECATKGSDPQTLRDAWKELDGLVGRSTTLVHDNREYAGVVEEIDPLEAIALRLGSGELVQLPASTTRVKRPESGSRC
jgi:BirA family biotin operon repressor/biotin-[acetyl-CoA-carboxylase] ligase